MKGHFPTPINLAERIVQKLFSERKPKLGDRILYPGLGTGPFVIAVGKYCEKNDFPVPDGMGVESDPALVKQARQIHNESFLSIEERDFLGSVEDLGTFEFIVGNPPYVSIEGLSIFEKQRYRSRFKTATGRFDLYFLFFEQALPLLSPGGRLSYITPEKFEYTLSASQLRKLLITEFWVLEIHHIEEDAFKGLNTYSTITTIEKSSSDKTKIILRNGESRTVHLPSDGSSWAPAIRKYSKKNIKYSKTLGDFCERISCGIATGADSVFVQPQGEISRALWGWTIPTISGRQLSVHDSVAPSEWFICPYLKKKGLVPEDELGDFRTWAKLHEKKLLNRTCVKLGRKPWYAWHETPPLRDALRPKLLCQDLTKKPRFWVDKQGQILPRHSVYYLVPKKERWLNPLRTYLNGVEARTWIESHAQKAANGYIRLQSTLLKDIPVPDDVLKSA